jgi:hypothetical protein
LCYTVIGGGMMHIPMRYGIAGIIGGFIGLFITKESNNDLIKFAGIFGGPIIDIVFMYYFLEWIVTSGLPGFQ